jgi:hypothetical protein
MPQQFTDDVMRTSLQCYQCSLEPPSHDIVKAPEKFKEKVKWRDFSEAFLTYMQRMKGQADFSLAYILRANEDHTKVDYYDYDTFEAYEEAIVPFSGLQYNLDNNAVFDALNPMCWVGPTGHGSRTSRDGVMDELLG